MAKFSISSATGAVKSALPGAATVAAAGAAAVGVSALAKGAPTPDKSTSAKPHNQATNSAPSTSYTLDFQDNILDQYDTYTYHWKLFITPLKNAYEGTVLSQEAQTIIAESGVSDLTIDKVEIHAFATPSFETGTGTQTHVKFEIVEPSGAGLLEDRKSVV